MAMRIVGMWEIVSSPDFGDDHLNEEGTPSSDCTRTLTVLSARSHRLADRHSGWPPARRRSILFSFERMDETDEVHGVGTAAVQDDHLVFTLMYHHGDDYTFEGRQQS
jgi:hypothetical protein